LAQASDDALHATALGAAPTRARWPQTDA